jgi:hypothetical protein
METLLETNFIWSVSPILDSFGVFEAPHLQSPQAYNKHLKKHLLGTRRLEQLGIRVKAERLEVTVCI